MYFFIDEKRDCENFEFTTTTEVSDDDEPMLPKKRKSKQREFENLLPSKDSYQIYLRAIMYCQCSPL